MCMDFAVDLCMKVCIKLLASLVHWKNPPPPTVISRRKLLNAVLKSQPLKSANKIVF